MFLLILLHQKNVHVYLIVLNIQQLQVYIHLLFSAPNIVNPGSE